MGVIPGRARSLAVGYLSARLPEIPGSIQSLKNLKPVPLDSQFIPLPTSPAVCKHIRKKGSSADVDKKLNGGRESLG